MKRIFRSSTEINKNFLTVLIVEDHISLLDSLSAGLKRHNYNILSAQNGLEARDRLGTVKIHVIILDLILPRISGFDLLQEIQQHREERSGFPYVIVMTGADTAENENRAEELGADEFMPKPVTIDEIAERIEIFQRRLVVGDAGFQFSQSRSGGNA